MPSGLVRNILAFAAAIVVVVGALWGLQYLVSHSDAPAAAVLPSTAAATTTAPAVSQALPLGRGSEQNTPPQVRFEVVTSEADQEKGLGGRASIPHDYAMLFVFPKDDTYGFWMKDMLVPIDMVWVSDSHQVLKVDTSVMPDTYPDVFYPPEPVRYVLETRAGEASLLGWTVGTTIRFPQSY